jgi:hypothetical protein
MIIFVQDLPVQKFGYNLKVLRVPPPKEGTSVLYFMNYYQLVLCVFNATLNNITAISWLSVFLVEEPEVPLSYSRTSEPVSPGQKLSSMFNR